MADIKHIVVDVGNTKSFTLIYFLILVINVISSSFQNYYKTLDIKLQVIISHIHIVVSHSSHYRFDKN